MLGRLIKQAQIVGAEQFEAARDTLRNADVTKSLHRAHRIADAVPGAHVLPGRFNSCNGGWEYVSAGCGTATIDEFVTKIQPTTVRRRHRGRARGVGVPWSVWVMSGPQ